MKVVFLQPIIPHYRKDIVKNLLNSDRVYAYFIASNKYLTNTSIEEATEKVTNNLKFKKFRFLGKNFYWLSGARKELNYLDPDVIVFTGFDPHMLHIVYLFVKYKLTSRKKLMWWSQGTRGNQGAIGRWIRSHFYKKADGILAYSKESKKTLIEMGVKGKSIKVINNSIPSNDYGFNRYEIIKQRDAQKSKKSINIITVGKLTKVKRIDLLINAAQKMRQQGTKFKIYIIGDGEHRQDLENLTQSFKLEDSVHMVGPKYGASLDDFFLNADIYVIPGAVGLSIVHAYSYGLPIITSNKQSIHRPEIELFENNKTGLIYEHLDAEDLAFKINELYRKVQVKRSEIAKACLASINKHGYTPEIMGQNIVQHIKTTFYI